MSAKQKVTVTRTRTRTKATNSSNKAGSKSQKRCPSCGKFMK